MATQQVKHEDTSLNTDFSHWDNPDLCPFITKIQKK